LTNTSYLGGGDYNIVGVYRTIFYDLLNATKSQLFATQYASMLATQNQTFLDNYLKNVGIGNMQSAVEVGAWYNVAGPPPSPSPPRPPPPSPPPPPPPLIPYTNISTHLGQHTCLVRTGKGVLCWGLNRYGQLGINDTVDRSLSVQSVVGLKNAIAIAAGEAHSCAVLSSGDVKCWGNNAYGQLGVNSTIDSNIATTNAINGTAVDVTCGSVHTCSVNSNKTVSCWGANQFQQLGVSGIATARLPTPVAGLSNVTSISAGGYHTCARLVDGTVKCWGNGARGQLGNGASSTSGPPVSVKGLIGPVVAVTAGLYHTCALLSSGRVQCWGDNSLGQVGLGFLGGAPPTAANVTNVQNSTVISISAGSTSTCAVLSSGNVTCWGANTNGILGTNTTIATPVGTPVPVVDLTGAAAVSVGKSHACAVLTSGAVKCWGDNSVGELGTGDTRSSLVPLIVNLPTGFFLQMNNPPPRMFNAGTQPTTSQNVGEDPWFITVMVIIASVVLSLSVTIAVYVMRRKRRRASE